MTVSPDGTFTYTPTDDARHGAAADDATLADKQDTFAVTVEDGHGFSDLIIVRVDVAPANGAPTGTATSGVPDPTSGTVTGSVTATDPDGDALSYTGSATTAKGSVVVNADGTFSYTPTSWARHAAAADGATDADKFDTFAVTVDDGHGGTFPVPVTVTIGSANTAPIANPSVPEPDPTSGQVLGSINASDPDGDNVTYTVTGGPGKGSVIVNADGAFTYTPTNAARHNAAAATATEMTNKTPSPSPSTTATAVSSPSPSAWPSARPTPRRPACRHSPSPPPMDWSADR